MILSNLKKFVKKRIHLYNLDNHRTIMSPHLNSVHKNYYKECLKIPYEDQGQNIFLKEIEEFKRDGFTSFFTDKNNQLAISLWNKIEQLGKSNKVSFSKGEILVDSETYNNLPELEEILKGELGTFLRGVLGTNFKVFYSKILQTKNESAEAEPVGSQLWHMDGGPSTVINTLFYINDVSDENGAMELLPWSLTKKIYKSLYSEFEKFKDSISDGDPQKRIKVREFKVKRYNEEIAKHKEAIRQPVGKAGLIVPFYNNILHKGGFPKVVGRTREVIVFHFYPSSGETPFNEYKAEGLLKKASYPKDPRF